MNEAFFELPPEKQQRIMNAGFEVFLQNEYKRASTDEIAARSNISKGLLFYYFHNKKTLYLYLFEKAMEIIEYSGFREQPDRWLRATVPAFRSQCSGREPSSLR